MLPSDFCSCTAGACQPTHACCTLHYSLQALDLCPGSQAFTPQAAYLNGRQCTLSLSVNVTNQTPTVPVDTSLTESSTMISLSGTDIIGVDGNVIQLRGINYFGFEQAVRHAAARCWDTCCLAPPC